MNRVVHFEIHADDIPRAVAFYQAVFDWKIERWGPVEYWAITTGGDNEPGINGGLLKRKGPIDGTAVLSYICTVQTASLDQTMAKVLAAGGENAVPRMPIPGVGWLAYCKDTEGNIFGVMQEDPSAR